MATDNSGQSENKDSPAAGKAAAGQQVPSSVQDPLVWLRLAKAYAQAGATSLASICYAQCAALLPNSQDPKVEQLRRAAHDNARLAGGRAMPQNWLAAARDPAWQHAWSTALQQLARSSSHQGGHLPSCSEPGPCIVLGGVGVQALQLAAVMQQSAAVSDPTLSAPRKLHVLSSHTDPLQRFIAGQVVASNTPGTGLPPSARPAPGACSTASEPQTTHSPVIVGPSLPKWVQQQQDPQQQAGVQHAAIFGDTSSRHSSTTPAPACSPLLVCPDLVASRPPSLHHLAVQLSQALPFLAPCAAVSPLTITVKAALAEGEQLLDQNRVDLDAMREHTGLDYATCNELLWRHSRSMQVDALEYRLLSDPFPLLTLDIAGAVGDALERINKIRDEAKAAAGADDTKLDSRTSGLQQQHLGKGFQECHDAVCQGAGQQGSSHSDTSAQGMALEEVQQQQQQQEEPLITLPPSALKRLLLKQRPQRALPGAAQWRGRVTARAREGGHLHAVVTWVEAELSPGVVISCAPRQVQGHSKETIDLQDHHVNGHSSKACCKESSDGVKAVGEGGAAPPAASSGVQPQMPSPHLSPHVWQMVHFIPVPVTLSPGQEVDLEAWLTGEDEVRLEVDESCLAQHPGSKGVSTGVGSDLAATLGLQCNGHGRHLSAGRPGSAESGAVDGLDTSSSDEAAGDLPAGEPLGYLSSSDDGSEWSEEEEEEEEEEPGDGGTPAGALILPYHMSMLNDHGRTDKYKAGIQGAVSRMLQRWEDPAQPPLVLDVGAGSGLLSMLAAQAGAPAVIGVERELPLALAAQGLVEANGLGDTVTILHSQVTATTVRPTSPLSAPTSDTGTSSSSGNISIDRTPQASAATPAPPLHDTGSPGSQGSQQEPGAAAVPDAGAAAGQLPRRADLVVHEIFGSDPLSEHILPTMRYVQEHLATPETRFMPSCFRVVAALATCPDLRAVYLTPRTDTPGATGHPSPFDLTALDKWAMWKVDVDLATVPGVTFLTAPAPVLTWYLGPQDDADQVMPTGGSQADSSTRVELQGRQLVHLRPCAPTPLPHWLAHNTTLPLHEGGSTNSSSATVNDQTTSAGANGHAHTATSDTRSVTPDCVLYWFEAWCGPEGGWLSTGPGHTTYSHWLQAYDFEAAADLKGTTEATAAAPASPQAQVDASSLGAASHCKGHSNNPLKQRHSATAPWQVEASWALDRVRFRILGRCKDATAA